MEREVGVKERTVLVEGAGDWSVNVLPDGKVRVVRWVRGVRGIMCIYVRGIEDWGEDAALGWELEWDGGGWMGGVVYGC